MPNQAKGTFDVQINPLGPDAHFDAPGLDRMSIDKTFHGDLDATSKGQMLSARNAEARSGGYVAIEKVSGTLAGRKGTFVLQHNGTMVRGSGETVVTVVPDSGTGELAGLGGKMAIVISDGKHAYAFDYTLADES